MAIRRAAFVVLLVFTAYAKAQSSAPTLTTLYNFRSGPSDGSSPNSALVIGRGRLFYGTTTYGGSGSCPYGCGTVFSLAPPTEAGGSWSETVLHSFSGWDGAFPNGVALGGDGVLYGTTVNGGISNQGNVFALTPPLNGNPGHLKVLHTFTGGNDGGSPSSGLVIGNDGLLYGTTYSGGTANQGTVFSLAPPTVASGASVETVLYSFNFNASTNDGYGPRATLVIGRGPVLYGTTEFGGNGPCISGSDQRIGCGSVFALTPPKSPGGVWTETILHNFTSGGDGGDPNGLLIGEDGVLYGTTYGESLPPISGGTAFSLTPPSSAGGPWTETVLHVFGGGSDGIAPAVGVVVGFTPSGRPLLYGTTSLGGGQCNGGTVYSLTPPHSPGGAWNESVVYAFPGCIGGQEAGPNGLIAGEGRVLYGTRGVGGTFDSGTAFSLIP
jgi:uncharacterized repeat protein (TIGR03803 family)